MASKKLVVKKSNSNSELQQVINASNTRYGVGIITTASKVLQPDRLSTGSFILDLHTLGGIPVNRGTMFIGEKHAGKTTMSDKVIASAQREYPEQLVVLLDVEGTHDTVWAEKLGVDVDNLIIVRPETGEMAVDLAEAIIRSNETSLVVIDSIAAFTPMREIDSSAEDALVGEQSRLITRFIRKVTAALIAERRRDHIVTLLYINQFRAKIGGMIFGDPRSIPGGKALEYSTSLQVIIKNKEFSGKDSVGADSMTHNEHSYTITKNKLNGGARTGTFILAREGYDKVPVGTIDDADVVLAYAKKFGFYSGGGKSWVLDFSDTRLTFGSAAEAVQAIRDDMGLYWSLRTYLIQTQAVALGMPSEFINRLGLATAPYYE